MFIAAGFGFQESLLLLYSLLLLGKDVGMNEKTLQNLRDVPLLNMCAFLKWARLEGCGINISTLATSLIKTFRDPQQIVNSGKMQYILLITTL